MNQDGIFGGLRTWGFLGLGGLALLGFHSTGEQYNRYRQVYGLGVNNIPAQELVFYIWYGLFGAVAVLCLAAAMMRTPLTDRAVEFGERLSTRPLFPFLSILTLFLEIICFRLVVLRDTPIADDEMTYRFIAETLLQGRLANPAPPEGAFFINKFVVVSKGLWYGKYPIGHPLLLALGEAVGLRVLVSPIMAALTAYITYRIGLKVFSRKVAVLSLLLFNLSPQFIGMGATDLSQPASALFMMLGVLMMLRLEEEKRLVWALLAGGAFGFLLLVRPFPGILLIPVVGGALVFSSRFSDTKDKTRAILGVGVPVLLGLVVLFLINKALTGDATQTSYHAAHAADKHGVGGLGLFNPHRGIIATSLLGGTLRLNFWLLGWPVSFLGLFFIRRRRGLRLLAGLTVAVFLYRIVVPKTVVSTLGPVYLTEAIPPLLLMISLGICDAPSRISAIVAHARRAVAAVVIASFVAGASCFLPIPVRDVGASAALRIRILDRIRGVAGENSLVFARYLVDPRLNSTWAPHPRNNSPTLDDSVLFVRPKPGTKGAEENIAFWRRRFPKRRAFYFGFSKSGVFIKPIRDHRDFAESE